MAEILYHYHSFSCSIWLRCGLLLLTKKRKMEGTWGTLGDFIFCYQMFPKEFYYDETIKWLKTRKEHIPRCCAHMQIARNLKEDLIFLSALNHVGFAIMNFCLAKEGFLLPVASFNILLFPRSVVVLLCLVMMTWALLYSCLINKEFRNWRFWNL